MSRRCAFRRHHLRDAIHRVYVLGHVAAVVRKARIIRYAAGYQMARLLEPNQHAILRFSLAHDILFYAGCGNEAMRPRMPAARIMELEAEDPQFATSNPP